jgi:hypothetical protein
MEGEVKRPAVGDRRYDVRGFGVHEEGRHNDFGCAHAQEAFESVFEPVADPVVAPPLGDLAAVEDMLAFGVNGGAADTGGWVSGGVYVEEKSLGWRWGLTLRDISTRG